MCYRINKEFFPFSHLSPPIQNARIAGWMGSKMRPPRWVCKNKDRRLDVFKEEILSWDGSALSLFVLAPGGLKGDAPCLVYYHGGGFFFEGAGYHYRLAGQYALECACRVVFVQYRLAPKNPHPTPVRDCYAALSWVFEQAERLHVNKEKIAVGGDSAGGALAAAVCQMARDQKKDLPIFQLLVYPVTDRRMQYDSCRRYTHTPMWNARLSKKMWQGYLPGDRVIDPSYASPMEAGDFGGLPPAYLETAEFDCLHDEGLAYADALQKAGVAVTINETKGTMHGFDIVKGAPTTRASVKRRIKFMKEQFAKEKQE